MIKAYYGKYNKPIRSWLIPFRSPYSTAAKHDPLRILFCGSDAFSIASLEALHKEHRNNPQSIASIDVVCRPPKATGRGLKTIREGKDKSNHITTQR